LRVIEGCSPFSKKSDVLKTTAESVERCRSERGIDEVTHTRSFEPKPEMHCRFDASAYFGNPQSSAVPAARKSSFADSNVSATSSLVAGGVIGAIFVFIAKIRCRRSASVSPTPHRNVMLDVWDKVRPDDALKAPLTMRGMVCPVVFISVPLNRSDLQCGIVHSRWLTTVRVLAALSADHHATVFL
jgi:hypothetical protein